jgi:hypothetical protein
MKQDGHSSPEIEYLLKAMLLSWKYVEIVRCKRDTGLGASTGSPRDYYIRVRTHYVRKRYGQGAAS